MDQLLQISLALDSLALRQLARNLYVRRIQRDDPAARSPALCCQPHDGAMSKPSIGLRSLELLQYKLWICSPPLGFFTFVGKTRGPLNIVSLHISASVPPSIAVVAMQVLDKPRRRESNRLSTL